MLVLTSEHVICGGAGGLFSSNLISEFKERGVCQCLHVRRWAGVSSVPAARSFGTLYSPSSSDRHSSGTP